MGGSVARGAGGLTLTHALVLLEEHVVLLTVIAIVKSTIPAVHV